MVSATALVESAVALRQEGRDKMFEYYERIFPEEIDKEVREGAMVNLRLMETLQDWEDERVGERR